MTISASKKSTSRTYGGLSNEQRKAERKERFLEAGLEVFGTVGIRGAKVRTLCKAAGLTERYFYESFTDTDDLFCAVYQQQVLAFQSFLMDSMPDLPKELEPRIRKCLHLFFSFMRDERVVRVLYLESLAGSEGIIEMYHQQVMLQADMATMMIHTDNPDISLSEDAAASIGLAINGATTGSASQWMLSGYKMPVEQLVEGCTLVVLGTMRELKALSNQNTKKGLPETDPCVDR